MTHLGIFTFKSEEHVALFVCRVLLLSKRCLEKPNPLSVLTKQGDPASPVTSGAKTAFSDPCFSKIIGKPDLFLRIQGDPALIRSVLFISGLSQVSTLQSQNQDTTSDPNRIFIWQIYSWKLEGT